MSTQLSSPQCDLHWNRTDTTKVIAQDTSQETTPLSTKYTNLLDALDLEHVETPSNGHHLWYDDTLHRYGLYINDAD